MPLEDRLFAAIDSMSEGFILLNTLGRVVHANIAVKSIFPRTADRLVEGADFASWLEEAPRAEYLSCPEIGNFVSWLRQSSNAVSIDILLKSTDAHVIRLSGHATSADEFVITMSVVTRIEGWKRTQRFNGATCAGPPGPPTPHPRTNTSPGLPTEAGEALQRVERTKRPLAKEVAERRPHERTLRRLANTDGLTGALNRRRFVEILNDARLVPPLRNNAHALMMIDIDHFKSINDAHGHHVGDEALCLLVDLCQRSLPANHFFARIGGEEFAALLTETTDHQCLVTAETIRRSINDNPFFCGADSFALSVSIGLVLFQTTPPDATQLLTIVDRALYQAKRKGRNRVHLVRQQYHRFVPLQTAI